ncbi:MAG: hypothetical protein JWN04_41, partial [Myxococcaceae bacterium]|nr:hypothetical protein [Myxococcaceae bacterium]
MLPSHAMVIVVPDTAWESEIGRVFQARLERQSWVVLVDAEAPASAVERARRSVGGQALGYVASSEALALEAIAAGADEALCFTRDEAHRVVVLADRAEQRAAMRVASEQERTSAVQSEKLAA